MNAVLASPDAVPTVVPIRGRLPALVPVVADALASLFMRRRRWNLSGEPPYWFEVFVAPLDPVGERIGIVIDGRPGELVLTAATPASIGELDWSDYAGTARLTAWTLAHQRPMMRLSRVFKGIVLPQSLGDARAPVAEGLLAIGFRIGEGDDVLDEGVMRIDPALVSRLMARDGDASVQAARRQALSALPVRLRVGAEGPSLEVAELRALEPGDVIVLGSRQRAFSRLRVMPTDGRESGGWSATWENERVRIDARVPWTLHDGSDPMQDSADTPAEHVEGAAAAPPDPLGALPLRVDFLLGELSVPLAKLSELEPGYVFALGEQLDHARIGIRANGKRIGTGRLVAVGDTLGVQLEGWEVDGLQ